MIPGYEAYTLYVIMHRGSFQIWNKKKKNRCAFLSEKAFWLEFLGPTMLAVSLFGKYIYERACWNLWWANISPKGIYSRASFLWKTSVLRAHVEWEVSPASWVGDRRVKSPKEGTLPEGGALLPIPGKWEPKDMGGCLLRQTWIHEELLSFRSEPRVDTSKDEHSWGLLNQTLSAWIPFPPAFWLVPQAHLLGTDPSQPLSHNQQPSMSLFLS